METKYIRTYETDEGPIRWYNIDCDVYGFDAEGDILDDGGYRISETPEGRAILRAIAKFEASK